MATELVGELPGGEDCGDDEQDEHGPPAPPVIWAQPGWPFDAVAGGERYRDPKRADDYGAERDQGGGNEPSAHVVVLPED